MTEPEVRGEADGRVAARLEVWRGLERFFALTVIVLGAVGVVASLAAGGEACAWLSVVVSVSEVAFGAVWLGLGPRLRANAGVGYSLLVLLPLTYVSVVSVGFLSQVAYYATLVGAVLACAAACRGFVRDYPLDAESTPVGQVVPSWRVLERLCAWATTLSVSLALVAWLIELADVRSARAWFAAAASVVMVAFGVLWLRRRERLWWGTGPVVALASFFPVVYGAFVPGVWPQVAMRFAVVTLVLPIVMMGRKNARVKAVGHGRPQ